MQEEMKLKRPDIKDNLVPTLNRIGYMLAKPEFFNQAFIDFAAKSKNPVLEIGAAYGVATLPALMSGASVIANDIDERHLAILKSEVPIADLKRLQLKIGRMPEEIDFPEESLDAVLASRVFSEVHPIKVVESFALIYKWLKRGGKFFYLGPTPYHGAFSGFISKYEQNKRKNIPWPGLIENPKMYCPERPDYLLEFIFTLDREEIGNLMMQAGFKLEILSYTPMPEGSPEEFKLDGREYVGAIGIKNS